MRKEARTGRAAGWMFAFGLATACATPEPNPAEPAQIAWGEGISSNAGTYRLWIAPQPAPIPANEPFTLRIRVEEARGESAGVPLEVRVDAGMPAHGHGMNVEPQVRRLADGTFAAEGLLFHMSGAWELYVDIERAGILERAQLAVEL